MHASIALAGLSAVLVGAIKAPLPRPTNPQAEGALLTGFTPVPTEAPRWPLELLRRATSASAAAASGSGSFLGWAAPDNTCGYVAGRLGASKTCETTQVCGALAYGGTGTMACCDTAQAACTFFGTCVNSLGYYSSSLCDHACQQDQNTVKCTEASLPYCYEYVVPGISVHWYSCDSTTFSTPERFETTFSGETDGRTWSKLYDTASATGGFPAASPPGASPTPKPAPASPTPTPSPTPNPPPKKSNAGPIAGGVVGGLAVLGAAAFAVFFLLTRRRKQHPQAGAGSATPVAAPAPGPGPAPDMAQQQHQQSMYGAPAGYDPNMDPNRASMAAGYFPAGKQDQAPMQHQQQQQQDGSYPPYGAAKYGPHETVQQVPGSPQPTSPAPPYAPPPQHVSELPSGVPPPQSPLQPGYAPAAAAAATTPPALQQQNQPQQQQPPPQQQQQQQQHQYAPYQPPAELGTSYGIPTHTSHGAPMFEAPAETRQQQQQQH